MQETSDGTRHRRHSVGFDVPFFTSVNFVKVHQPNGA
jgi:hypothetical protein